MNQENSANHLSRHCFDNTQGAFRELSSQLQTLRFFSFWEMASDFPDLANRKQQNLSWFPLSARP